MTRMFLLALPITLCASAASADDPIWAPYQETAQQFCAASPCTVVFPAITTETLIKQASCIFTLNQSTNSLVYAVLYNNPPGSGTRGNYLQFFSEGNSSGIPYYGINAQTYVFASTGQVPRVQVFSDPAYASLVACNLSGYTRSGLPGAAGALPPPERPLPSTAGSLPPFAGSPAE